MNTGSNKAHGLLKVYFTFNHTLLGRLRGFVLQILRKVGELNLQAAIEKYCDSARALERMLRQVKFL